MGTSVYFAIGSLLRQPASDLGGLEALGTS